MAGRNCCKCVTVSLVPTASLILVILFACGIVLLPILYVELSHDYKYGIIIDAGSSHTTLYGYRWSVPTKNNSTGVIDVQEFYQCSSRSLTKYASKPTEAGKALQKCLIKSKDYKYLAIDEKLRPYMPIYLGATAGMRVLEMVNSTNSSTILKAVRAALKNSSYQFKEENAKIISGEEEAIGGWTTTNYLDKNLNPPKESTVGSLDLGGASAEIAFQVNYSSANTASEQLFSQKYNLYARSYLCYGVNEARGRLLASFVNSAHLKGINLSNTSIPDPCLMKGTNVTYHHSEVYTGCVTSQPAMEAFGFSYAPPTSLLAETGDINFVGTWNADECLNNISKLFNFSQCWPKGNCASGNKFTPPQVNGSFTAFSAFYYTANYFAQNVTTITKSQGWKAIQDAVQKNCSVTRNSTNDTCIVKGKQKKSCYQNCFNGLFMLHLLENGFGFKNQSTTNSNSNWSVEFQDKVNNISVGWALGYMLNQTSHISQKQYMEDRPYTAVDLVVGILILTILSAVFVIFFFLTFYACRKALRPRNGFQPL